MTFSSPNHFHVVWRRFIDLCCGQNALFSHPPSKAGFTCDKSNILVHISSRTPQKAGHAFDKLNLLVEAASVVELKEMEGTRKLMDSVLGDIKLASLSKPTGHGGEQHPPDTGRFEVTANDLVNLRAEWKKHIRNILTCDTSTHEATQMCHANKVVPQVSSPFKVGAPAVAVKMAKLEHGKTASGGAAALPLTNTGDKKRQAAVHMRRRKRIGGLNGFVLFRSHKKHCITENKDVTLGDYLQLVSTNKGATALGAEHQKSVHGNGNPVSPAATRRKSSRFYANLWKRLPFKEKKNYIEHASRMKKIREASCGKRRLF